MGTHTGNPGALAGATGAEKRPIEQKSRPNPTPNRRTRQAAVAIIRGKSGTRRLNVEGRQLWALRQLLAAGAEGVTPITHPGPRWSDYVRKLRLAGLDIETIREPHGGPYAGTHGRYVLRGDVTLEPLAEKEVGP